MKVRAIQAGFIYGVYRFPGSVIELRSGKHFSKEWMEEVAEGTPVVLTQPKAPSPEDVLGDTPLVPKNTPIPLATLESFDAANTPVNEDEPIEGDGPPSGDRNVI